MKVSDILRVKGNTLYTATPDEPLASALNLMAEKDIGSLVVMDHGDLVGMLTFREVIQLVVKNGGAVGTTIVRTWIQQGGPQRFLLNDGMNAADFIKGVGPQFLANAFGTSSGAKAKARRSRRRGPGWLLTPRFAPV